MWYERAKRGVDLAAAAVIVPVVLLAALALVGLNAALNPGPLFFRQTRMGRGGAPFTALKFRTMLPAGPDVGAAGARGAFDALEAERITPLGRVLRRTRIDELPQILNVLAGSMSLIGPRPDQFEHAEVYLETIPGYAERLAVKPGITGLAQTEVGYVSCRTGFRRKVRADLLYIRRASMRTDAWILARTAMVVAGMKGS